MEELDKRTIKYIEETPISHRKDFGQYFTPKSIRDELLSMIPRNLSRPKVLDPSCGTGEFLNSSLGYFKDPELYGWDIDQNLINIAKEISPEAKLKVADSLYQDFSPTFDIVIGNPPYFEFKPDIFVRNRFSKIINGRSNIFSLFIKLGLDLLKEGGYLAYVIPPSMNNGAYFSKLRNYIMEHANVESLKILDNPKRFRDAQQTVSLLVLKKGRNKGSYIFKKDDIKIFSPAAEDLKRSFEGKKTLRDLGYIVRTGRVVWNQHKEKLTRSREDSVPLIWSHNITEEGVRLIDDHRKPQYIKISYSDTGPAIVVNRIVGQVGSARLRAALLPEGMRFVGENHVNVIFHKMGREQTGFLSEDYNLDLPDILSQLKSEEKISVIQQITGNTQISKTELENLFPIDLY